MDPGPVRERAHRFRTGAMIRSLLRALHRRSVPEPAVQALPVRPARLRQLRLAAIRHTRGVRTGHVRSPFTGPGLEVVGVRPYQDGDPVRGIDWRVTARKDELHLRTWEADRELPVIVLLDGGAWRHVPAFREGRARALEAAHWLVAAAEASGHPVGILSHDAGGMRWCPPARGRPHMRRVHEVLAGAWSSHFPGASSAEVGDPAGEVLSALELRHPQEAAVLLISPFDMTPDDVPATRQHLARTARRHQLTPVWIDAPPPLPHAGVVLASAKGRNTLVNTSAASVRRRYEEALDRWRHGVRAALKPAGIPSVILDGEVSTELVLARAFSAARRGGPRRQRGRGLRSRRSRPSQPRGPGTRINSGGVRAAVLGLALVGLAHAPQVGPTLSPQAGSTQSAQTGEALSPMNTASALRRIQIVSDTLDAIPVLGSPVTRTVTMATRGGGVLRESAREARMGEVWDEGYTSLAPRAGDTLWVLEQTITPWWMGFQRLPDVELTLAGDPAAPPLLVQAARVEVLGPAAVAGGPALGSLAPSWPQLPRPGASRYLQYAPLVFLVLGLGAGTAALVARRRSPESGTSPPRSRSVSGARIRGRPPREALDLAMAELRVFAASRRVSVSSWTRGDWERWEGGLTSLEAGLVTAVVDAADETRFRPAAALSEAVDVAADALDRLGRLQRAAGEDAG